MPQLTPERNPFMLMINPEVVFAAIEASSGSGSSTGTCAGRSIAWCRSPMPLRRRWSKTTTTWNCLPKTDCAAATRGGGCYERISCVQCIVYDVYYVNSKIRPIYQ